MVLYLNSCYGAWITLSCWAVCCYGCMCTVVVGEPE